MTWAEHVFRILSARFVLIKKELREIFVAQSERVTCEGERVRIADPDDAVSFFVNEYLMDGVAHVGKEAVRVRSFSSCPRPSNNMPKSKPKQKLPNKKKKKNTKAQWMKMMQKQMETIATVCTVLAETVKEIKEATEEQRKQQQATPLYCSEEVEEFIENARKRIYYQQGGFRRGQGPIEAQKALAEALRVNEKTVASNELKKYVKRTFKSMRNLRRPVQAHVQQQLLLKYTDYVSTMEKPFDKAEAYRNFKKSITDEPDVRKEILVVSFKAAKQLTYLDEIVADQPFHTAESFNWFDRNMVTAAKTDKKKAEVALFRLVLAEVEAPEEKAIENLNDSEMDKLRKKVSATTSSGAAALPKKTSADTLADLSRRMAESVKAFACDDYGDGGSDDDDSDDDDSDDDSDTSESEDESQGDSATKATSSKTRAGDESFTRESKALSGTKRQREETSEAAAAEAEAEAAEAEAEAAEAEAEAAEAKTAAAEAEAAEAETAAAEAAAAAAPAAEASASAEPGAKRPRRSPRLTPKGEAWRKQLAAARDKKSTTKSATMPATQPEEELSGMTRQEELAAAVTLAASQPAHATDDSSEPDYYRCGRYAASLEEFSLPEQEDMFPLRLKRQAKNSTTWVCTVMPNWELSATCEDKLAGVIKAALGADVVKCSAKKKKITAVLRMSKAQQTVDVFISRAPTQSKRARGSRT